MQSFYETGEKETSASKRNINEENKEDEKWCYSMNNIWKKITLLEVKNIIDLVVLYNGMVKMVAISMQYPLRSLHHGRNIVESLWKLDGDECCTNVYTWFDEAAYELRRE